MTTDEARAIVAEFQQAVSTSHGTIGNAELSRFSGALAGAVNALATQLDALAPKAKEAAPSHVEKHDAKHDAKHADKHDAKHR